MVRLDKMIVGGGKKKEISHSAEVSILQKNGSIRELKHTKPLITSFSFTFGKVPNHRFAQTGQGFEPCSSKHLGSSFHFVKFCIHHLGLFKQSRHSGMVNKCLDRPPGHGLCAGRRRVDSALHHCLLCVWGQGVGGLSQNGVLNTWVVKLPHAYQRA